MRQARCLFHPALTPSESESSSPLLCYAMARFGWFRDEGHRETGLTAAGGEGERRPALDLEPEPANLWDSALRGPDSGS